MRLRRIVPIAAALALLGGGLALAGPGRHRHEMAGRRFERLARELDLTDGQKARIREIFEQHRADGLGDAARKARDARLDLRSTIRDPSADESAIRDAAAKASQAEADLAVERHRAFAEVYKVLTPEQQEKAKALKERVRSRRSVM